MQSRPADICYTQRPVSSRFSQEQNADSDGPLPPFLDRLMPWSGHPWLRSPVCGVCGVVGLYRLCMAFCLPHSPTHPYFMADFKQSAKAPLPLSVCTPGDLANNIFHSFSTLLFVRRPLPLSSPVSPSLTRLSTAHLWLPMLHCSAW